MNYLEASSILGARDHKKVANNTYLVRRGPDTIGLRLHNTDVLTFRPGSVTYNTGGWRTMTTKSRFNKFGPDDVKVYSDRKVWELYLDGHNSYCEYFDGYTYNEAMGGGIVSPPAPVMTPYRATMIAEGVEEVATEDEYLAAWQYLIDTGLAWTLQGFFGRTASDLIASGKCTR